MDGSEALKDAFFMMEALKEARKAFEADEVPVGAVAVFDGQIVARAHNEVEALKDASAHAELLCLKRASAFLGRWRLYGVRLYTTLEPCSMCAGALSSFRIDQVIWAAPDLRLGADGSFVKLLQERHPIHQVAVTQRVLEAPAADLMREFFRKKRRKREDGKGL